MAMKKTDWDIVRKEEVQAAVLINNSTVEITEEKEESRCDHCDSYNTSVKSESCYSDDSDEPTVSNHIVNYDYLYCNDCGDVTTIKPKSEPIKEREQEEAFIEAIEYTVGYYGLTKELKSGLVSDILKLVRERDGVSQSHQPYKELSEGEKKEEDFDLEEHNLSVWKNVKDLIFQDCLCSDGGEYWVNEDAIIDALTKNGLKLTQIDK